MLILSLKEIKISQNTREGRSMAKESQAENRLSEAYDKVLSNLREILSTTTDLTRTEFDNALKQAGVSLENASKFTQEEIDKARKAVRKDWQNLIKTTQERRDEFLKSEQFQRFADTSLGALGKLTKSIKDWASVLDEKIDEQITYHTGEVAGAGTFECTKCGNTLTFKKSGRIPPCGKCKNTEFKRVID
jgi:rubrerythrin